MKEWNIIVFKIILSVGSLVSVHSGSEMMLKAVWKKMKFPKNISITITRIYQTAWQRICLQISGSIILNFLLTLEVFLSRSYFSVHMEMAPSTSMIKLVQSNCTTFRGIFPIVNPPIIVMVQITILIVSWNWRNFLQLSKVALPHKIDL